MKTAQQHQSIQIFENAWMEKWLTHIHPITPLVVWTPIWCWFIYRSFFVLQIPILSFLGFGLLGLLVWTFTEYVMHRYVFHFIPHGKFQERLQFLLHGVHHDDPVDPTRLVMPPVLSLSLGYGLYLIYRVMLGPVNIVPFFSFFIIGYLSYDYTHYAVHHFTMRSKWGKMVKKHHMLHHYATHDARWGVSSPFWDVVFRTQEERKFAHDLHEERSSNKAEPAASH